MKLYVMRDPTPGAGRGRGRADRRKERLLPPRRGPTRVRRRSLTRAIAASAATKGGRGARGGQGAPGARGGFERPSNPLQIVEIDLGKLFADSAAGTLKGADVYERVCGTIPAAMKAGGDMAPRCQRRLRLFPHGLPDLASKLPPGTKIAEPFGPRGMGAGPPASPG